MHSTLLMGYHNFQAKEPISIDAGRAPSVNKTVSLINVKENTRRAQAKRKREQAVETPQSCFRLARRGNEAHGAQKVCARSKDHDQALAGDTRRVLLQALSRRGIGAGMQYATQNNTKKHAHA